VEALRNQRNIVLDGSTDLPHGFDATFAKLLWPFVGPAIGRICLALLDVTTFHCWHMWLVSCFNFNFLYEDVLSFNSSRQRTVLLHIQQVAKVIWQRLHQIPGVNRDSKEQCMTLTLVCCHLQF